MHIICVIYTAAELAVYSPSTAWTWCGCTRHGLGDSREPMGTWALAQGRRWQSCVVAG